MDGDATITAGGQDVLGQAGGQIDLGVITATDNSANRIALQAGGSIVDTNAGLANVQESVAGASTSLSLRAGDSIGGADTGNGDVLLNDNAIDLNVDTVAAISSSGVYLRELAAGGALIVDTAASVSVDVADPQQVNFNSTLTGVPDGGTIASLEDLETTNNGPIKVVAEAGSITVNSATDTVFGVRANGTGDVLLESRGAASDVIVATNAHIISDSGNVTFNADDDVDLNASVTTGLGGTVYVVAANGTDGDATGSNVDGINIDAIVTTESGDVLAVSSQDIRQTDGLVSTSGDVGFVVSRDVLQTAGGDVTTTTGDVLVESGRDWTMDGDATITAGGQDVLGDVGGVLTLGVITVTDASANRIALQAGGDILDANAGAANVQESVSGAVTSLSLRSGGEIGQADETGGTFNANAIDLNVDTLAALAVDGIHARELAAGGDLVIDTAAGVAVDVDGSLRTNFNSTTTSVPETRSVSSLEDLQTTADGSIKVVAEAGSISVNAAADASFGVSADGSGDVLLAARGSSSDVTLNGNLLSGTGHLSVTADDDVDVNANITTTGAGLASGTVFVSASNGTQESVGVDGVILDGATLINSANGNVRLLAGGEGDVFLNSVQAGTGTVSVLAERDILDNNAATVNVTASTLRMVADLNSDGSTVTGNGVGRIGDPLAADRNAETNTVGAINTDVDLIAARAATAIYVLEADALVIDATGDLSVDQVNFGPTARTAVTDASLTDMVTGNSSTSDRIEVATTGAGGDITISRIETAGTIIVTSVTGGIIDGRDDNSPDGGTTPGAEIDVTQDLIATEAALTAQTGIGHDRPLETALRLIAVSNNSGNAAKSDIEIENSKGGAEIVIGTVDGLVGATNRKGDIIVTNSSPLTVVDPVSTDQGGDIALTAFNTEGVTNNSLTVEADVTTNTGGNINLVGGTNVIVRDGTYAPPTISTDVVGGTRTGDTVANESGKINIVAETGSVNLVGGSSASNAVSIQRTSTGDEVTVIDVVDGVGGVEQGHINVTANQHVTVGSNVNITAATATLEKIDTRTSDVNDPSSIERLPDIGLINISATTGTITVQGNRDSSDFTTIRAEVDEVDVVERTTPAVPGFDVDPFPNETSLISMRMDGVTIFDHDDGNTQRSSLFSTTGAQVQSVVGVGTPDEVSYVTSSIPAFFQFPADPVPLVDIFGRTSLTMFVGVTGEQNVRVVIDWGDESDIAYGGDGVKVTPGTTDVDDRPNATVYNVPQGGVAYRFYHQYDALAASNRDDPAAAFQIQVDVIHNSTNSLVQTNGERVLNNLNTTDDPIFDEIFDRNDNRLDNDEDRLVAELPGVLASGNFDVSVEAPQLDLRVTVVADVVAETAAAPSLTQNEEVETLVIQAEVAEERLVILRVYAPNGEKVGDDIQLQESVLEDLPKLFSRLPDGRYGIYLQEAGETRARLIIEVRILEGKAVTESNEAAEDAPDTEKNEATDLDGDGKPDEEKKDGDSEAKDKNGKEAEPDATSTDQSAIQNTDDRQTSQLSETFWEQWQPQDRAESVVLRGDVTVDGPVVSLDEASADKDQSHDSAAIAGALAAGTAAAGWADRVDKLMARFKKGSMAKAAKLARKLKRKAK